MKSADKKVINQAVTLLGEWLEHSNEKFHVRDALKPAGADALITIDDRSFLVEFKSGSSAAQISNAIEALKNSAVPSGNSIIPLVVVPFMGDVGRMLCKEAGVSWLDLSGNADILGSGLRILIEGRPNRFKKSGRPSNPFAPKSSRISRWLLMYPERPMNQREIAQATGMDEGLTSRVISRLERDGLVVRSKEGVIMVSDPEILLEAWKERYDFTKHEILKGTAASRSSEALLKGLPALFTKQKVSYAVTGLGAAWLYTKFSGFRIVTVYIETKIDSEDLDFLFREEPRGANLWLVFPNDEGVFQGAKEVNGVRAVHPVQVYLDLSGHPERAKEASDRLRNEMLKWGQNA